MDYRIRVATTLAAAALLGGCATGQRMGQRMGWTATPADATALVQASCDEATRSLKGGPDHGTALSACLDAKTRQHLRN